VRETKNKIKMSIPLTNNNYPTQKHTSHRAGWETVYGSGPQSITSQMAECGINPWYTELAME